MGGLHKRATTKKAIGHKEHKDISLKKGKRGGNVGNAKDKKKAAASGNKAINTGTNIMSLDDDLDNLDGTTISCQTLSSLQDKIKRDPEAYKSEYESQLVHFEAILGTLLLSPQKPSKEFGEQFMFICHVTPYYCNSGNSGDGYNKLDLPKKLIGLISEHMQTLHPLTRKTLVTGLILLRNRDQYPLEFALPLHLKLLGLEDRGLKSLVYKHIVNDILRLNTIGNSGSKSKDGKKKSGSSQIQGASIISGGQNVKEKTNSDSTNNLSSSLIENHQSLTPAQQNKRLQQFLFDQLFTLKKTAGTVTSNTNNSINGNKNGNNSSNSNGNNNQLIFHSSSPQIARKAMLILISLYKKRVWTSPSLVNQIGECVVHTDIHTAKAAIQFLLGNMHLIQTDEVDGGGDGDGSMGGSDLTTATLAETKKNLGEMGRKLIGRKKMNKQQKKKKLKLAKKTALKKLEKSSGSDSRIINSTGLNQSSCFAAIDLLHDPQRIADKLLIRVAGGKEPFSFRLLALQLCSRLCGRHELQLVNFFPFITRYLKPSQREVTTVLASLAQACHSLVPAEDLQGVVRHLINEFATESAAPEVIVVGLNTIREIAARCPNTSLTTDQIMDLIVNFRKFKGDKGVRIAIKGLINMYREINPELLHKQFRGKEAQESLLRGEFNNESGKREQFFDQGMALLTELKMRKEERRKMKEDMKNGLGVEGREASDDEEEGESVEEDSDDESESDEDSDEQILGSSKKSSSKKTKADIKSKSKSDKSESKTSKDKDGFESDAESDEEDEDESEILDELEELEEEGSDNEEEEEGSDDDDDEELDSESEVSMDESGAINWDAIEKKAMRKSKKDDKTIKKKTTKESDDDDDDDGSETDGESDSDSEADVEDEEKDKKKSKPSKQKPTTVASDSKTEDTPDSESNSNKKLLVSRAARKRQKLQERNDKKQVEQRAIDDLKQKQMSLLTDTILTQEDFQKMKKLQHKKALSLQMGRLHSQAHGGGDIFDDSSDESSSSDTEDGAFGSGSRRKRRKTNNNKKNKDDENNSENSDYDEYKDDNGNDIDSEEDSDEHLTAKDRAKKAIKKAQDKVYNDIDFINPEKLLFGAKKRKNDKQSRMNSILEGRQDRKELKNYKSKNRAGGSTNKEKLRNKAMLMTAHSSHVKRKTRGTKATLKIANLRKHIGNLKKKACRNKRRR